MRETGIIGQSLDWVIVIKLTAVQYGRQSGPSRVSGVTFVRGSFLTLDVNDLRS